MKKVFACIASVMCAAVLYADVSHFTETVAPASTIGAVPVSNGYDWSMTTGSNSPPAAFRAITVTTMTATGPVTLSTTTMLMQQLTLTQVAASSPTIIGQAVWCTNCAAAGGKGTVCYSTATATAANSFVLSTGTACQ